MVTAAMNHADTSRQAAPAAALSHTVSAAAARLAFLAVACLLLGCGGSVSGQEAAGSPDSPSPPGSPTAPGQVAELAAEVRICRVPDPRHPDSAFTVTRSKADRHGDYYMTWQCREPCDDWRQCDIAARARRGVTRRALAFVIDGMGGHLAYTTSQRGDETLLLQDGVGGISYLQPLAEAIEERSDAATVMVRWEPGFNRTWGWFTRTSAEATRIPAVTRRIAGVIAWVHEHLAGPGAFGTVGCSMGTQATFGAVYWYAVDDVVDYQLFSGGPGLWDINAGCGLRTYSEGRCDLDAGVTCSTDADCIRLGEGSRCDRPRPIPPFGLYQAVINHVHATQACTIPRRGEALVPYAPFDESSFAFSGGDWDLDHPVDFAMDVRGRDGDENWALGDTMRVFDDIESAAGHSKRWQATVNSNHCAALYDGVALEMILERMDLR